MAAGEVSEGRKRENAVVALVIAGTLAAVAHRQISVHWPWLLGEPARERIGATVTCEREGLEVEPVAVPSTVTWPAAPVYDELRVRVRRAGGVLGQDLPTVVEDGRTVVVLDRLPEEQRGPLGACIEREQAALVDAAAAVLAEGARATEITVR